MCLKRICELDAKPVTSKATGEVIEIFPAGENEEKERVVNFGILKHNLKLRCDYFFFQKRFNHTNKLCFLKRKTKLCFRKHKTKSRFEVTFDVIF